MFFNSRSLKNKISELHDTLYSGNFSIICIVESWLNNYITDAMLDSRGLFDIMRCDHPTHGGGVVALVHKRLHAECVTMSDNYRELEIVVFDLPGHSCKLRLFVVYRTCTGGNSSFAARHMRLITDCFTYYCSGNVSSIVMGDFNCELIDWTRCSAPLNSLQASFLFVLPAWGLCNTSIPQLEKQIFLTLFYQIAPS